MKDEPDTRLPRTERYEAPLYLAKYLERQARSRRAEESAEEDGTSPLYLRRFRERRDQESITEQLPPLYQRVGLEMQQALTEDNRTKEISAPPQARLKLAADVYLIRHGETQGYSTEAGLTPAGTWQAHTYGHNASKRVSDGETIVIRHADTNRAGQTAANIHRGLLDGLAMFEKGVKVFEPAPMEEFRNFGVATPEGIKDITSAFRHYYATLEEFERTALGDRPMWLVEVDRFWRTQTGGSDPIQHWLTVPMMHFEPPALVVRRFWQGIRRLAEEFPGARLLISTHSGPIRAFAITAFGYDPGEPYNAEHVRIKLKVGGREALVSYRNRVQEIHVPEIDSLPTWELGENWRPESAPTIAEGG